MEPNHWLSVFSGPGFLFSLFALFLATLVGFYGVFSNNAIPRPWRVILSLVVILGALANVVSNAWDREGGVADNWKLQKSLDRLQSRIVNTKVTYQLSIPVADPRLRMLRAAIIARSKNIEYKFNHLAEPEEVMPRMALTDVLRDLPATIVPADASAYLLRSADIAVELDRPPFPSASCLPEVTLCRPPDLLLSTDYLTPLPETVGKSMQLPTPFAEHLPRSSPYTIWMCSCRPPYNFNKPAPFIEAYDVPAKIAERSGQLDSLADLPGSRMTVYVRPDLPSAGFHPEMMRSVNLTLFTLSIDGINYHANLDKAIKRVDGLLRFYEFTFPNDWNPQTRTIP